MALVIQKFGGTSVGSPERIKSVASRVAATVRRGNQVVVVVSAMGDATNELMGLAKAVSSEPNRREVDMLLSAGERVSMALLSMALHAEGVPAISFTGSQSGIITDTAHTRARIQDIRPIRIGPELDKGRVVIVAGFQGVSPEKEVTTLGRGGSDTTAIALASALDAATCEIYTDVDGVMSADPRLVADAKLIPTISWRAMADAAHCGAGVMHYRAASLAEQIKVPYTIRSSFRESAGTLVGSEETSPSILVTGQRQITAAEIRCSESAFAEVTKSLEPYDPRGYRNGDADDAFRFLIPSSDDEALGVLNATAPGPVSLAPGYASVSIVGISPRQATGCLEVNNIHYHHRENSELSVTFLVNEKNFEEAIQVLHRDFASENQSAGSAVDR